MLRSFTAAAKKSKIRLTILGTEATQLSSALQLCDKKFLVKPTTHGDYIKQLLSIVKRNKVDFLVPTVDLDLKVLSRNKARFAALDSSPGTRVSWPRR